MQKGSIMMAINYITRLANLNLFDKAGLYKLKNSKLYTVHYYN